METTKALETFLRAHSEEPISTPKRLGGGYYADVYLVQCGKDGPTVLKAYKQAGVMQEEIAQLGILREHASKNRQMHWLCFCAEVWNNIKEKKANNWFVN